MKKIKIALFHYHFLPGGITTVAINAVNALLEYAHQNLFVIEEIVFVSGKEENLQNIVQEQIKKPDGIKTALRYDISDSIDYLSEGNKYDEDDIGNNIYLLLRKYEGFIWWIHNYHLGKNPIFTQILTEYLLRNKKQNAILQIHDFPECARPDNYRFLIEKKYTIYPIESNIRYAVINTRDERYLKEAGIPDKQIFLLYDPVSGLEKKEFSHNSKNKFSNIKNIAELAAIKSGLHKNNLVDDQKTKYKEKLIGQFRRFFPAINPENPFALYPVRTIRRKNILEAALLARITGNGFNLIVTLPGISAQEKKYSETVKECFEKGYAPGIWGCGSGIYGEAVTLETVINASDFVISSSIMEGFGYHMIDSLRWGKPLITKYLDIQESFSEIFKNTASFFYNFVTVPVIQTDREKIKQLYFDSIRRYSKIMENHNIELALYQIDSILNRDSIDFSYLPVYLQTEILAKISNDKIYKKEVKRLNYSLTEKILKVIKTKQNYDTLKIADYFSFSSFADAFFNIINSFGNNLFSRNARKEAEDNLAKNNKEQAISQNLLNLFFRPEFLRLLLSER